jgi:DNA-binding NtrC family response regulator
MQRPITMLIADDSHAAQQIIADAARASKLPLRLSMTDNGRDCLTLLNGSNVDVAFVDVQMPELLGTEAVWSARKLGIQTFVTLMSSPPAVEAVNTAIRLRAYEFLFKPFHVDDVVSILKTYERISSPTKVLIVDDSTAVRQIVQKIIQASIFNCEIANATDGETALAICRNGHFDVVFLDCNMPGMNGIATMKQLKVIQQSVKIVMISGEHNSATEEEAVECGACAFLHKPFNTQDVDQVLHSAFGLRSPNLKVKSSAPNFDIAIEGSTIRLAHRLSGHIFEYLWSQKPPYLRNGVVKPSATGTAAPSSFVQIAEKTALLQLRSAKLLAAA